MVSVRVKLAVIRDSVLTLESMGTVMVAQVSLRKAVIVVSDTGEVLGTDGSKTLLVEDVDHLMVDVMDVDVPDELPVMNVVGNWTEEALDVGGPQDVLDRE